MEKVVFAGSEEDYRFVFDRISGKINWLDISCDYDELVQEIADKGYSCLLVMKKGNFIANKLLWECGTLTEVKIIDSDNPYEIEVKKGKMSNKKIWDYISVNASSQIEEGGFYHCFNNEPFSQEEVKEYVDNAYLKLKDHMDKEKTAFEIGCASGLTMFRLLPYLKAYIGVDMAGVNIRKNKESVRQKEIKNVELFQCEADKIGSLSVGTIDILIINSVAQYFPGINYFRDVIIQGINMMGEEGILYIGDVMDLAKRKDLVRAALQYKEEHPDADTRTDYSDDLFFCRKYFEYLSSTVDGIYKIEITDKIGSIKNEMTNYRYDVILYYKRDAGKLENYSGKTQSAEKLI